MHRCTCSHAAHQSIESNVESALSALKVRWPSRLCVVSVDECDCSSGAQHPSAGDLLYYKPEGGGQTHYLPARCYCTHRHCDGRTAPEEVGTGNEASHLLSNRHRDDLLIRSCRWPGRSDEIHSISLNQNCSEVPPPSVLDVHRCRRSEDMLPINV